MRLECSDSSDGQRGAAALMLVEHLLVLSCLGLPAGSPAPAACPDCALQHEHLDLPVPDVDTRQLLNHAPADNGPPAPVQQIAAVPPALSVRLGNSTLLHQYMRSNIVYLLKSFDVDHMLYHFRLRAGLASPPPGNRKQAWDNGLAGSNAGRFLMGAGNTLRWIEHKELRAMMDAVVDGIEACRNETTGYIMAYEPAGFMHSEQGDYGRSWVTQGLIEAGKAGNSKAFPLLRRFYDWFNDPEQNPYLPYLYDGVGNAEQGQIASTRMYLETPVGLYLDSQVAQDTYRDDVWLRQLIAKEAASLSDYHMPAPNHPHCYEITAFLSMHDNFRATHNTTWLAAAQAAWDLIVANFLNVDGTSALAEGRPDSGTDWHPKSYPLRPTARTGETCCSTFWVKFNQRFQLLAPSDERYAAEIEKTLYNAVLRQLGELDGVPDPLNTTAGQTYSGFAMRSFVNMQGYLEKLRVPVASCCEAQGSRALGSLPEYVFSLNASAPADGFFLNMFVESTLEINASVVVGVAPNPPPKAPSPPVKPVGLSPLPPPPPLTWNQIARDGYYKSGYDQSGSGYWPVKATSFVDCQHHCINSTHPNNCQGISWYGPIVPAPPPPLPPSPPVCTVGCTMVATGHSYYTDGAYGKVVDLNVSACNAACANDADCVQTTIGPTPRRCELYTAIYSTALRSDADVQGFLKCSNNACTPSSTSKELSCATGCTMEATSSHQFYGGDFSVPVDLDVAACNAACLKNASCVQTTVGPTPRRCVL